MGFLNYSDPTSSSTSRAPCGTNKCRTQCFGLIMKIPFLSKVYVQCIFHDFSVLCQPLFVFFWYRNIVVGYCVYFMILVFHIVHEESPFRFSLLLCWHDWRQGSLKRVKILETKYWLLGNSFIKGHFVKTRHLSFILYSTSYWINISDCWCYNKITSVP